MVSLVREIPFTLFNNCIILCIYMCTCTIFHFGKRFEFADEMKEWFCSN